MMLNQGPRARYDELRRRWPALFENSRDSGYTIMFDPEMVHSAEEEEVRRLAAKGLPASWSRTGVVYEDEYMLVVRDAVRHPDGHLGTYVRTMPASGFAGVAILPIINNDIVLLHHSRHATRASHLEIPRGFGEVGVSAVDQAQRELLEEIGAHAEELVDLGPFHCNTGTASDQTELFVAVIKNFGELQSSEGISRAEVYAPPKVAELIMSSGITDAFTIAAFTRAWLRGFFRDLPASAAVSIHPPVDGG